MFKHSTILVEAYPLPLADFSFLPERPVEGLDEVEFTNASSGEQLSSFSRHFIDNQGYRSENKNTSYLFSQAGLYSVALVVQNSWGCSDTTLKHLTVESDFALFVPNAFTPNGDDLNEVFLPVVRSLKKYHLQIFDRWGEPIFITQDPQQGWDGTYKGEPAKEDVYTWKIVAVPLNGDLKSAAGQVLLSRW